MADAHEQQHKDSSVKNEVSMTNEKTLRDKYEEVKGKAKRLMANDEISKSERKIFESEKEDFESKRKEFESQKTEFESQKTDLESQKTDLESQKTEFELQKALFKLQKAQFELQKADLELQKKTFESEMIAKFESELRQIEGVRKRAFDAREKFFYRMEEDFMIYAERWMRFNHVHETEIESRMWSAHKEMASRRVYYDGSKQLYSELDELMKPLAFSLTEVALLPSVEEEFA
ncbi:hypothetical protein A0O28_0022180 [Trichoderma guizhouense]|uniref:Uncharacterized protein n=1 Tax=Trichoderma guizhouense TaxID=1491466 RepID=A0A1T3CS31_9HYPO|nr:hypothetical protein A0O28_0022180 [Trichoderma guizhouense]